MAIFLNCRIGQAVSLKERIRRLTSWVACFLMFQFASGYYLCLMLFATAYDAGLVSDVLGVFTSDERPPQMRLRVRVCVVH